MFLAEGLVALLVVIVTFAALKALLFPKKRGRHSAVRAPAPRTPRDPRRRVRRDEFEGEPGSFWGEDDAREDRPPLSDEDVQELKDKFRESLSGQPAAVVKTTDDAAHSGGFPVQTGPRPVQTGPRSVLFMPPAGTAPVSDETSSFGALRDGDTRTACELFGHLIEEGKCRDCREEGGSLAWPALANASRTRVEPARSPDDPGTATLPAAG